MTEVGQPNGDEVNWETTWETFQREHPEEAAEALRMMEGAAIGDLGELPPEELHQRLKDALQEMMRHGAPLLAVRRMHESLGKIAALPEAEDPTEPDSSNI